MRSHRCLVSVPRYRATDFRPKRCQRAGQAIAGDMLVSPDGRNRYVDTVGPNRDPSGYPIGDALEVFAVHR